MSDFGAGASRRQCGALCRWPDTAQQLIFGRLGLALHQLQRRCQPVQAREPRRQGISFFNDGASVGRMFDTGCLPSAKRGRHKSWVGISVAGWTELKPFSMSGMESGAIFGRHPTSTTFAPTQVFVSMPEQPAASADSLPCRSRAGGAGMRRSSASPP